MRYRSMLETLLEDYLYNPSIYNKVIYYHQLRDGRVYIFNSQGKVSVEFSYFGNDMIHGLKFYEGYFADREPSHKLNMKYDPHIWDELKERLHELLPRLGDVSGRFKWGAECFILESMLHDSATVISIGDRSDGFMRVVMRNELKGVFMRFRYRKYNKRIDEWIINDHDVRYSLGVVAVPDDICEILDQLFLIEG